MKSTHLIGLFLIFAVVFIIPQYLDQTPLSSTSTAPLTSPTPSPSVEGVSTSVDESIESTDEPYDILQEPTFLVTRVIDGDTIELENGKTVRYIGVDTPETKHPTKGVECYGQEAYLQNKALVEGKNVVLESDVSETDRYGRLLRYVYLEGQMVNETLVKEGYAQSISFPPDVKYQDTFKAAEQVARENNVGLWSVQCTTLQLQTSPTPSSQQTQGCNIKGNINSSKDKIFHVPGCNDYNKTSIDESAGERWFCSEQDAIDAGWRKAKNC